MTEFEGFVEYGGPSIAISGGTTVTVAPGFYQPIFAVREMTTKVTIWDGATLVMGGLTREGVKKVNDKVPVLGSLPSSVVSFAAKVRARRSETCSSLSPPTWSIPAARRSNRPQWQRER